MHHHGLIFVARPFCSVVGSSVVYFIHSIYWFVHHFQTAGLHSPLAGFWWLSENRINFCLRCFCFILLIPTPTLCRHWSMTQSTKCGNRTLQKRQHIKVFDVMARLRCAKLCGETKGCSTITNNKTTKVCFLFSITIDDLCGGADAVTSGSGGGFYEIRQVCTNSFSFSC